MKKFFIFLIFFVFCCSLQAEKVYREDGSFFEVKRNIGVFASEIDSVSLKSVENYSLKWSYGDKFIVVDKKQGGNLPVYFVDAAIVIAADSVFYDGSQPADFIAKKYGLTVAEIWDDYNLIEFKGSKDSVKTARQIVENGDGFAFPNLIRKSEFKTNPVVFPIVDKYYKENYQWSLKNIGKAITPNNKEIETLKNADVKFEEAMEFIHKELEGGNLENFSIAKVAIMDSGVDFEHPDLKNKLDYGYNVVHKGESGNPGEIETGGIYGDAGYSHGTNCAGVAAAEGNEIGTVGICPWCRVYPVTYMEGGMGSPNSTSDSTLLEVYAKYAEDPEIVAVNCSFGPMAGFGDIPATSGEIQSHKKFIEKGRNGKGGAIVYASGNDGVDASYTGILTYEFKIKRDEKEVKSSVITVGATSAWDTRASYSNWGSMLDIVAPSLSIKPYLGIAAPYLVGSGKLDSDYTNEFSGTSASAPVITGALGVIFSINPDLTLEEGIEILHKSSDKINPESGFYDESGHSVKFGYGRLNLLKAARLALGLDMCETPSEEIENNIDDNCDGYVDEGFAKDLSKVSAKCKTDADCDNKDFSGKDVECLTGEYEKYNLKNGYCVIKNTNFACPDGTSTYSSSYNDSNCLLECGKNVECPEGFACSDPILGRCFPKCKEDSDCSSTAFCNKNHECQNIPSEPMGTCETKEDCKYDADMCVTEIPDGLCLVMCFNDDACGDQGSKCAEINVQGYSLNLCFPPCEEDDDCRSFGQYRLKCHSRYNGKENLCGLPCETDDDCYDPDMAKCDENRRCVPTEASSDKSDELDGDAGGGSDSDVGGGSDSDVVPDDTLEDDAAPNNNTNKKKDSGCSALLI